ncbi:MAG TPA: SGNH/GDSL hydrolase family protein [Candidatus Saccharimonadaceae bacterium]|nr:SGNH/GDSL hydrolase family protein [Candidatus Saccharimonadaceae bacterium]
MDPLRLVVIGDSTSFTDDTGPKLPSDKRLYPNVLGARIEAALQRPVSVNVVARAGTDVREAWKMVAKDRHVQFEVLMGADAVVVGVGSIDHAPAGIPAFVETLVPYLRPERVRRAVRLATRRAHGTLVRATGGRFTHTPPGEFARLYDGVLFQTRALARGAAGVALGPTSHRSRYYGEGHPTLRPREALQKGIATHHGFPFVSAWDLVEPFADQLNPDGVHWPPVAHQAVAEALAAHLIAQLQNTEPRPPIVEF